MALQGFESSCLQVLSLPEGITEALEDVARMVQRIWTSQQLYCVAGPPCGPPGGREFCSLLNYAIRSDNEALLEKVAPEFSSPSESFSLVSHILRLFFALSLIVLNDSSSPPLIMPSVLLSFKSIQISYCLDLELF